LLFSSLEKERGILAVIRALKIFAKNINIIIVMLRPQTTYVQQYLKVVSIRANDVHIRAKKMGAVDYTNSKNI